jgi:hypothetical protein
MSRLLTIATVILLLILSVAAWSAQIVDPSYYLNNTDVASATYSRTDIFTTYNLTLDLDYQTLDVVYFWVELDDDYELVTITYRGQSSLDSCWVNISYGFVDGVNLSNIYWHETIQDSSLYWYQGVTRHKLNMDSYLGQSRYVLFKFVGGGSIPSGGLDVFVTIELKKSH